MVSRWTADGHRIKHLGPGGRCTKREPYTRRSREKLCSILAPSWLHLGSILAHLGSILAPSWPILALSWPMLAPSWLHLGSSWLHLGPSWLHLGLILARLGPILAPSWLILPPSWAILAHLASPKLLQSPPQTTPKQTSLQDPPTTP